MADMPDSKDESADTAPRAVPLPPLLLTRNVERGGSRDDCLQGGQKRIEWKRGRTTR